MGSRRPNPDDTSGLEAMGHRRTEHIQEAEKKMASKIDLLSKKHRLHSEVVEAIWEEAFKFQKRWPLWRPRQR